MKSPKFIKLIVTAVKMQLMASVPKEHADLFWDRLFFHNFHRAFIQSIIVIFVDIISILMGIYSPASNGTFPFYIGVLAFQICTMVFAIYMCYKTSNSHRAFGEFEYRIMDLQYIISYLGIEVIIFLLPV